MQITMQQQCRGRVQAFQAGSKASHMKASAPTQFAGLRRANALDMESNKTGSLAQVGVPQGP